MILVVGDVIHDQWFGLTETGRRDPATGAEVHRMTSCKMGVGGAGMVAAMTASLGAWTRFLTVAPAAALPCEMLRNHYDVAVRVIDQPGRTIPVKTRIPVGTRGVRLDCEDPSPVSDETTEALRVEAALAQVGGYDWCVVADYGKGVMTPSLARKLVGLYGRRLIVDPAPGRAWGWWSGAGVLKCNAKQAAGRTPPQLCERYNLRGAVVTHGAAGASWCFDGVTGQGRGKPTLEVDATGCGDQFLAALAIGLTRGVQFQTAVDTANMIAALQAERETIAPVRPADFATLSRAERARCREVLGA